jgi:soluble lytic murein transglycosylase-like protein
MPMPLNHSKGTDGPSLARRLPGCVLAILAISAVATSCAFASTVYRVRAGDTLTQIAQTHGTSVGRLERLNHIAPGGVLLASSLLRLPARQPTLRSYRVQPGDSLSALAERFDTTAAAIAKASHMTVAQVLLAGATVEIPVAETKAETTSPVRQSLARWSRHYQVDPHLATALAWMESGFNNRVVSPAGAVGIMQITPVTWQYVQTVLLLGRNVDDSVDGNVRIGVAFLHHLLHLYNGNEKLALAAYYQGPRSLQLNGPLPETQQYVADILALKSRF